MNYQKEDIINYINDENLNELNSIFREFYFGFDSNKFFREYPVFEVYYKTYSDREEIFVEGSGNHLSPIDFIEHELSWAKSFEYIFEVNYKSMLIINDDLIQFLEEENIKAQKEVQSITNYLKKIESRLLEKEEPVLYSSEDSANGALGIEALRMLNELGVMEYLKSNYSGTSEAWGEVLGRILNKKEKTIIRNCASFFGNRDSGGDDNDFREGRLNEVSKKVLGKLEPVKKVKK